MEESPDPVVVLLGIERTFFRKIVIFSQPLDTGCPPSGFSILLRLQGNEIIFSLKYCQSGRKSPAAALVRGYRYKTSNLLCPMFLTAVRIMYFTDSAWRSRGRKESSSRDLHISCIVSYQSFSTSFHLRHCRIFKG